MTTQPEPLLTEEVSVDTLDLMRQNQKFFREIDLPQGLRLRALDLAMTFHLRVVERAFERDVDVDELKTKVFSTAREFESYIVGTDVVDEGS